MNTKTRKASLPLDILNIETIVWPSHLETAGEICLRYNSEKKNVGFVYLGKHNPDDELSQSDRLLGSNKEIKVKQFSKLISQKGVSILVSPELTKAVCKQIKVFSRIKFRNISELKEFNYKGAAIGLGVASSLISKTRDPDPNVSIYAQLISVYIREALMVFEQTLKLIEKYQPKEILTFNGRFALSKPIWEASRIRAVKILFHERGADYSRFILQNRPIHDFSYIRTLIVNSWDDAGFEKAQTGHTFFARRKQGDGIGWVSFTGYQERGFIPEKNQGKRIVYFSSSDDEYAAIGDLVSSPLFISQRVAVGWLINYVEDKSDLELIIRLHPNKLEASEQERSWWESLCGKNVAVINPGDKIDSYGLAASADVVVSYGSTMGIEAAYWGTPSILLGDAMYRGMDCVYEPKSLQELTDMLDQIRLDRLPAEKCLPYGYYFLTRGYKYNYYKPETLFSGFFLGAKLTIETPMISHLKTIKSFYKDCYELLKKAIHQNNIYYK